MANAAFRSSANTADFGVNTLAATKPSGVVSNDGLVALVIIASSGTPPTVNSVPSSWTERGTGTFTLFGLNIRWYYYSKLAGGSEPSSYTWGITASADVFTVDIHAYDNVKTAGFWGQLSGTPNTGTGTSMTAPAITTDQTNQTVVAEYIWDFSLGLSGTPPSGMTERVDTAQAYLADVVQAAAGSTGTKVATASASTGWAAWLVGLYGEDSASGGSSYPAPFPRGVARGQWRGVGLRAA